VQGVDRVADHVGGRFSPLGPLGIPDHSLFVVAPAALTVAAVEMRQPRQFSRLMVGVLAYRQRQVFGDAIVAYSRRGKADNQITDLV
jgi:hypothetical protein